MMPRNASGTDGSGCARQQKVERRSPRPLLRHLVLTLPLILLDLASDLARKLPFPGRCGVWGVPQRVNGPLAQRAEPWHAFRCPERMRRKEREIHFVQCFQWGLVQIPGVRVQATGS